MIRASGRAHDPEVIRLLLTNGATLKEADASGVTPLLSAASFSANPDIIRLLVELGGNGTLDAKDSDEQNALTRAIRYNHHPRVIAALLEAGADPRAKCKTSGWTIEMTPLGFAATFQNAAAVEPLVRGGAWINSREGDGRTPLMRAVICHFEDDVVPEFLRFGADVNARDSHGWTALKLAKDAKRTEIVSQLIEAGARE